MKRLLAVLAAASFLATLPSFASPVPSALCVDDDEGYSLCFAIKALKTVHPKTGTTTLYSVNGIENDTEYLTAAIGTGYKLSSYFEFDYTWLYAGAEARVVEHGSFNLETQLGTVVRNGKTLTLKPARRMPAKAN